VKSFLCFIASAAFASAADPNRTVQGGSRAEFRETLHTRADPLIPSFRAQSLAPSRLRVKGTDTMADLMKIWMAGFTRIYPQVRIELEAKGSLTGAAPLTAGESDLATFSREMFPSEVAAFQAAHGYPPLAIKVALGAFRAPDRTGISVFFVNRENPIASLTLDQLAAIYCQVPGQSPILKWGQLGLRGAWADRLIEPIGISMPDGTANFIRHYVGRDTDFNGRVKGERAGLPVKASVRILADIARNPGAIGYVTLLYENAGTKPIAIARTAGGPAYRGTFEEVADARYPLTRFVYLYVNRAPGKKLDPKCEAFLRYVLSREGQRGVEQEGLFLPLPARLVSEELGKLK
jgi:phosphate transport system substrate-binding protein